jgi:hypothetical protein
MKKLLVVLGVAASVSLILLSLLVPVNRFCLTTFRRDPTNRGRHADAANSTSTLTVKDQLKIGWMRTQTRDSRRSKIHAS